MAGRDGLITVEVVYALPDTQWLVELKAVPGTTAWQAIEQSGALRRFPEINLAGQKIGIFSKFVRPDAVLKEGDRVEIYRPLIADPKEVRRRRARQKA